MSAHLRHAAPDWQPSVTRVRYVGDDTFGMGDRTGTFVGNSDPLPGVKPRGWLGVLVQFDGESGPLDVDPDDIEFAGER